jgi:hypothetical protein
MINNILSWANNKLSPWPSYLLCHDQFIDSMRSRLSDISVKESLKTAGNAIVVPQLVYMIQSFSNA